MREIKFRAWDKQNKTMNECCCLELKDGQVVSHKDSGDDSWLDSGYYALMQYTGLKDKNGKEIYEGDVVSLDGNMTADDSLGFLPNGWIFNEEDKYMVSWDTELAGWILEMDTKPDSEHNAKYMNHARGLFVQGNVEVVGNIYENPELLKKL